MVFRQEYITNLGKLLVENCNITAEDENRGIARGIDNLSTTIVNNCTVFGLAAGVRSMGTTEVNGGMYDGYIYGGMIFFGENKTSYVKNATIRYCAKPSSYTGEKTSQNVGLSVCDIDEEFQAKISNSKINTNQSILIDSEIHKLYIGTGCNFTATNTSLSTAVESTNNTYIK